MLYTLILVIHTIVCVCLVAIVLLQIGKGSGMSGLLGGGSSDSLISGTQGNVLLKKITAGCAILFMCTSLTLSFMSAKRKTRSLMDIMPPAPVIPQDVVPGGAAPQETQTPAQQNTNTQQQPAPATK